MNPNTPPLISIIMAAYNTETYIYEAIASVVSQSYPHWELIVVNDQSTDGTEQIIQSFQDKRIKAYSAPHRFGKPSSVKNYGSQFAQGEFLFFFDSDDILLPDAIQGLAQYVQGHPGISAAYGFSTHIDQHGNSLPSAGFKLIPLLNGGYSLPKHYAHIWKRVATLKFVASPNILIRRQVFASTGGFDDSLAAAEDTQLYLKLFLQSIDAVGIIPHYLVAYRQHPSSLTKSVEKKEQLLQAHIQMTEWFYADPRFPSNYQPYRPFAICKAYNHVAGVRLSQGDQKQAFQILLRGLNNPGSNPLCWFQVCMTTLLRCFLPTQWDTNLKSLVVDLRDGVLSARIKRILIPFGS